MTSKIERIIQSFFKLPQSNIMKAFFINFLLIGILASINNLKAFDTDKRTYEFSRKFKFGAASAAYQIEGAWDVDGKSPSIWDDFTHDHPELIADRSSGDVSADSYHLFMDDIAALKQIGVEKLNFYFFPLFMLILLSVSSLQILVFMATNINKRNNIESQRN